MAKLKLPAVATFRLSRSSKEGIMWHRKKRPIDKKTGRLKDAEKTRK